MAYFDNVLGKPQAWARLVRRPLVQEYRFEPRDDQILFDSVGGYHGNRGFSPGADYADPVYSDEGLYFGGDRQTSDLPRPAFGPSVTVFAAFKLPVGGRRNIFIRHNSSDYKWLRSNGRGRTGAYIDANTQPSRTEMPFTHQDRVSRDRSLNIGEWNFFAFRWDGETFYASVNGHENTRELSAYPAFDSEGSFNLMGDNNNTENSEGTFGYLSTYETALSDAQIFHNLNVLSGGKYGTILSPGKRRAFLRERYQSQLRANKRR